MKKQDQQYIEQFTKWKKTSLLGIASCDLNIEFYQKQIDLLEQMIMAEQEEKKAKQELLNYAVEEFNKWKTKLN